MNVAVTGAAGFIGRHVVTALVNRGVEVIALSRNPPSDERRPEVQWLALDVESPTLEVVQHLAGSDRLIHLAWGELTDFNSLRHFEVLLPTHYRFLKKLVEAGLQHLTVAGTCLEYGLQSGCLHEDLPSEPVTAYGHAKLSLYRQLGHLKGRTNFRLNWARFFYLYGEGQPTNTLYAQVQAAIAARAGRFAMSRGEQLRDYLHVGEAADLLVRLALLDYDSGIVNLCSGAPVSIRSLVEEWFLSAGFDVELDRGAYGYPLCEPLAFWGARRKLDELLGIAKF